MCNARVQTYLLQTRRGGSIHDTPQMQRRLGGMDDRVVSGVAADVQRGLGTYAAQTTTRGAKLPPAGAKQHRAGSNERAGG